MNQHIHDNDWEEGSGIINLFSKSHGVKAIKQNNKLKTCKK